MADFRKWFLVLAVLAAIAVPASAQLQCTARASNNLIRDEGITELVGDTVLTCANDITRRVAIEASINQSATQITSNLTGTEDFVDAFLLVTTFPNATAGAAGVPATAAPIRGRLVDPRRVLWENIEIPAVQAPATQLIIRITNIRVDASALRDATSGGANVSVQETISVASATVLEVQIPDLTVATLRRGLNFTAVDFDETSLFNETFQACVGRNPTVNADEAPDADFQLRFREGIPNAFRAAAQERNQVANGVAEILQGVTSLGIIDDDVTNSTRLRAIFSNVPTGVNIYVSSNDVGGTFVTAVQAGTTGSDIVIGTNTYRRVSLTGGAGEVTWNITSGGNLAILDEARFNVIVSFPANVNVPVQAGPTPVSTVGGTFAPVSTNHAATEGGDIPRFINSSTPQNVFTLAACVTNLLFPYVTNQAGFDTGVAIVNTSLDNSTGASGVPANQPFNTTTQSGTCTVYYFGAMGNGGQLPAPQTTATIAAGQMVTFALSAGGVSGATTSAASFQGYLIARCNFQFGHGLAFITDVGVNRVAHGYLALVIPDRGGARVAEPFITALPGSGEQLVQ